MASLDDKLHTALEHSLGQHLNEEIIRRGWDYYRSGQVLNVKQADEDTLYGAVQGSDVYSVLLDSDHFRYSKCTCPFNDYCKHMAAVYFAYCHSLDGESAAKAAYDRITGVDRKQQRSTVTVSVPKFSGRHVQPSDDASPEEWGLWMDAEYGETWRSCRHSLHALQPVLSALKGTTKHWDKKSQRLHWMSVILFVLDQAEQAIKTVDTFSRYYHEMSFLRMAEPWVEHYYTLALELEPAEVTGHNRSWVDYVAGYAKGRAVKNEQQLFDWTYIYLAICERMAVDADWYEHELDAMRKEELRDSEEPVNRTFVHTAAAMLCFFGRNDEEALAHFGKTDFQRSQKVIYPCVAQRLEEGDWELIGHWMSFLYDHISKVKNARTIGPFMTLCRRADTDQPDEPRWTRYMVELLPHSYADLSDHWLAVQKYEEWADLQLLIGMKPDDLGIQNVREVSKAAPSVMIPLYHQSIEEAIHSRNRQGYRLAVKELKKLERLYKADKHADKWERYIEGIASKYQRLRAFQEELWKGKIVT
ncbi:hypothetical protein PghCCS26_48910 [Paenibacillus glycanilyticus]|uniref:SWIM-type domain-containing protein n=1 Tax=Paenibacillus glycanilyticus TaxID=126569 RepID=A0ABQ6NRQ1_9BACL|nr:SWIM zinc finger family protein [Paenibacillus glycanilyticus]GMK47761.1 hypothetical protein PghCCS26_48910 [Paenibacillus glycanilyticus]